MATKKKTSKPGAKAGGTKKTAAKSTKKPAAKKAAPKTTKKTAAKQPKKAAPKLVKKTAAKAPKKAAPKTVKKTTAKAPKKAAPKAVKKTAVKPKSTAKAAPRKKPPVPKSPAIEQKVESTEFTSSVTDTREPKKSPIRIIIPLILIIIVVGAYLYLSTDKFFSKKQPVPVKPRMTDLDKGKPEAGAQKKEPTKMPVSKKETIKESAEDAAGTYTVQYKDQLTEISKVKYGNYADWKKIYKANKEKIKDPHVIFPGQKLKIP